MRVLKEVEVFLMFILLFAGAFALLIASHEAYHYFSINGKATGVCFGECNIGNGSAVGAVYWEDLTNVNIVKEEKNAWIFAFIFTFGLLGVLVFIKLKS